VVAKAVDLDDQVVCGPVKVNQQTIDNDVATGLGKAVLPDQLEEAPLEL